MKTKLTIFTILGCFFMLPIHSQYQKKQKFIDSLITIAEKAPSDTLKVARYGTIYEQLMFIDPELSFTYARKEYQLAKSLNYKQGMATSYLHFANYYKDRGVLDSADYYFTKSVNTFTEINSTIGIIFVNHSVAAFEKSLGNYDKALEHANKNIELYNKRDTVKTIGGKAFNLIGAEYELIGGIHQEMGNYNIALNESLKALEFFEEKKDTLRKADALMQIGNVEHLLGNYESAVKHGKEAYEIYEAYKDLQYQCYASTSIGDSYLATNAPKEAKSYFEKALNLSSQIKNKELQGTSLIGLGGAFLKLKQYQKARSNLNKGLAIHKELNYKKSISIDLNQLGKLEIDNNKPKKAITLLDNSIQLAKEIKAKDNLVEAYLLKSKALKLMGDNKNALINYVLYKISNDSIFNTTKSQQIEELRTIYETEKKEQQIAIQKNEINLLEQKAEINSLQRSLLGLGLGLSLLVLGFGYYGIRQKMKRNKLERAKVDAELAFKKKELTTHALHLAKKNETLEGLKQKAQEFTTSENGNGFTQLIRSIDFDLQDDNNWENFARYFEEVHKDFNGNVKAKYPQVTSNELRLMALLKMNLSSKEIANILNISSEGIKKARYRLRKKLDLQTEESLQDLVMSL